jgi:hypothetical protein
VVLGLGVVHDHVLYELHDASAAIDGVRCKGVSAPMRVAAPGGIRNSGSGRIACFACERVWTNPCERWRIVIGTGAPKVRAYCIGCAVREFRWPRGENRG